MPGSLVARWGLGYWAGFLCEGWFGSGFGMAGDILDRHGHTQLSQKFTK